MSEVNTKELSDNEFEKYAIKVPNIPNYDTWIPYRRKCDCGGTIVAVRDYDAHNRPDLIRVSCATCKIGYEIHRPANSMNGIIDYEKNEARCPLCNHVIGDDELWCFTDYNEPHYCENCGAKLDWKNPTYIKRR